MESFNTLLSTELRRIGFGNSDSEDAEQSGAEHHAHAQAQELKLTLGAEWSDIVRTLSPERNENDLTRIVGFGCAIAEFTTGFLVSGVQMKQLVQLGGLCNLIVALYDYYLDHPVTAEKFVVPRSALEDALIENDFCKLQQIADRGTHRERIMCILIQRYLEQLNFFTAHRQDTPLQYRKTFVRLIMQMFDAQNATIEQGTKMNAHLVMRKSAQSVVALGLPVWLIGIRNPPYSYFSHLLWLYRIGDFISWVDDFADFTSDCDKGSPNRLLTDRLFPYERAVLVARNAVNILKYRENLSNCEESIVKTNKLFTYFVYNWLK